MSRSKSSSKWLKEHHDDAFVKRARQEGLRSRAVFKLQEIDTRDRLLKPGMNVVDLGAAPGGWSEYAVRRVGRGGRVMALDLLDMDPIAGVDFIRGDFTEAAVLEELEQIIGGPGLVDLVLSDMAPNISGMKSVDQPRAMYLAELALDLAKNVLKPSGCFLTKIFQGEGFDEFLAQNRVSFQKVLIRKPEASRTRSREVYLLGRGFKA